MCLLLLLLALARAVLGLLLTLDALLLKLGDAKRRICFLFPLLSFSFASTQRSLEVWTAQALVYTHTNTHIHTSRAA
jgi:hypothetical protein